MLGDSDSIGKRLAANKKAGKAGLFRHDYFKLHHGFRFFFEHQFNLVVLVHIYRHIAATR